MEQKHFRPHGANQLTLYLSNPPQGSTSSDNKSDGSVPKCPITDALICENASDLEKWILLNVPDNNGT